MRRAFAIAVLVACLLASVFAGGSKEDSVDTQPVVTVDQNVDTSRITAIKTGNSVLVTVKLYSEDQITKSMVDSTIEEAKAAGEEMTAGDAIQLLVSQTLRNQLLAKLAESLNEEQINALVSNAIMDAASSVGLSITTNDQAVQFVKEAYGLSVDEYANLVVARYLMESYISRNYADVLEAVEEPTEEQMLELYNSNLEKFNAPASLRVAHIFRTFAEREADNPDVLAIMEGIRDRIGSGSITFEKAASDYSQDPSSSQAGGLINGWLQEGDQSGVAQLGQNGVNAVFALGVGEISDVVEGSQGYHIFKVVSRRDAKVLTMDDYLDLNEQVTVKQYIHDYLYTVLIENAYSVAYAKVIESLMEQANITYNL